MATVSYTDITPELEEAFFTGIKSSDRFVYSRLIFKTTLQSRKKKKGVTLRSLLPQISALWQGFSSIEKQSWSDAADAEKGVFDPTLLIPDNAFFGTATFGVARFGQNIAEWNLNGYRLFVQDQSLRIKNDFAGVATPSILHQSLVGDLHIASPATQLKITQIHPHFYWVSAKVKGKKSMYQPVLVTEDLTLPITISLNYKSSLSSAGASPSARFYARFWYSYQGLDKYQDLEIPLDFSCAWKNATVTLTELTSYVIRYDLYIELIDLQGDLYVDNIKSEHGSQNWVRDPLCKDINQGFTRAFYQIPKHWSAVILPAGAEFESIYKDF